MTHHDITDPRLRRLRKALRKAEKFVVATQGSYRAKGRYNQVVNRAKRLGAFGCAAGAAE